MALQCAWLPVPSMLQDPQLGPFDTRNACGEVENPESPATVLDLEMPLPALLWPVMHPYLSVLPSRPFLSPGPALGCTVEFSLSLYGSWLLDLFEAVCLTDLHPVSALLSRDSPRVISHSPADLRVFH